MSDLDRMAVRACQRPVKREACPCPPCAARREIFGANIPVQIQEQRRANGNLREGET